MAHGVAEGSFSEAVGKQASAAAFWCQQLNALVLGPLPPTIMEVDRGVPQTFEGG